MLNKLILLLLVGLALFVVSPASTAVAAAAESRASGSAASLTSLIGIETRLSENAVRENAALGYDFASDDAVAARGTTTLYRSASAAEHADIAASGVLRAGPNSFSTGKWFWESAESAAKFGSKMDGAGNLQIIEATFPRSTADQFMRLERLDGIGPARFGTFDQLGTPSLRLWPPSP